MTRPEPPTDLQPYFLTLHDFDSPICWHDYFGNDHPVELDVGCGRGLFLFNSAMANPDINYLGIEIDYREGRRAAKRFHKRELPNVRVLGGDVHVALTKFIPAASVSAVHVYFPDPWWKKKHRRRRVFTDVFAELAANVLVSNGHLHSWTDVEEYFQVISNLMNHHELFKPCAPPAQKEPANDLDYQTGFERSRRKLGCEIYRGLWQRVGRD